MLEVRSVWGQSCSIIYIWINPRKRDLLKSGRGLNTHIQDTINKSWLLHDVAHISITQTPFGLYVAYTRIDSFTNIVFLLLENIVSQMEYPILQQISIKEMKLEVWATHHKSPIKSVIRATQVLFLVKWRVRDITS